LLKKEGEAQYRDAGRTTGPDLNHGRVKAYLEMLRRRYIFFCNKSVGKMPEMHRLKTKDYFKGWEGGYNRVAADSRSSVVRDTDRAAWTVYPYQEQNDRISWKYILCKGAFVFNARRQ
jgi:hypothetical protein